MIASQYVLCGVDKPIKCDLESTNVIRDGLMPLENVGTNLSKT